MNAAASPPVELQEPTRTLHYIDGQMTFTSAVGAIFMFPLSGIIRLCIALRIHPNVLTLIGVCINLAGAWALALGHFFLAGVIIVAANVFDFIDGKVAHQTGTASEFGGFWDSVMDRFSDLALFLGLVYLYASLQRADYVLVTALAMTFTVLTSYTRARAERPERIVLFMIGAFTNRMAAVLWVILVLSVLTVAGRIYHTWRELESRKVAA